MAQKDGILSACNIIESNIDLVSPLPLAFMSPGGTEPRRTLKSDTFVHLQAELQDLGVSDHFMLDGYPIVEERGIALSVDGMDFIHSAVNQLYALSVAMHISQLARRAVEIPCKSVGVHAVRLDFHFDDPAFVPLAKVGEQRRRDEVRSMSGCSPGAIERIMSKLDPQMAPPKQWESLILMNRAMKSQLVNGVAAYVLCSIRYDKG